MLSIDECTHTTSALQESGAWSLVHEVLETAGRGVLRLGMRLVAFQLRACEGQAHGDGHLKSDLVLRYLATSPMRRAAIERRLKRTSLHGLTAPAADVDLVVSTLK